LVRDALPKLPSAIFWEGYESDNFSWKMRKSEIPYFLAFPKSFRVIYFAAMAGAAESARALCNWALSRKREILYAGGLTFELEISKRQWEITFTCNQGNRIIRTNRGVGNHGTGQLMMISSGKVPLVKKVARVLRDLVFQAEILKIQSFSLWQIKEMKVRIKLDLLGHSKKLMMGISFIVIESLIYPIEQRKPSW